MTYHLWLKSFLVFYICCSTLLHVPPSDFTVSEDAGMGSNPGLLRLWHWQQDALATWLDLIHSWLDLIHTWLDLIHTWLDLIHFWLDLIHTWLYLSHTLLYLIHTWLDIIHTWLDLIHNKARSHPHLARSLLVHIFSCDALFKMIIYKRHKKS